MKRIYGRASEALCPRRGYAWLIEKTFGHEIVVATNCKVWACLPCRDRNLAAVKLRIEYGSLMVSHSCLITLTYKFGGGSTLMQGPVVERHLRKLFSRLKIWWPNLSWMKVPELTRQNQVHLHLVVGGIPDEMACERDAKYDRKWRSEGSCLCVEHRVARLWHDITGGGGHSLAECGRAQPCSYVVDARAIVSPREASAYLGKYLVKGLGQRRELFRRGFVRRWASSRNWPKANLLTRGSARSRWHGGGYIGGYDEKLERAAEKDSGHYLLERVGSDSAVAFDKANIKRAKISRMKRKVRDLSVDNVHSASTVEGVLRT